MKKRSFLLFMAAAICLGLISIHAVAQDQGGRGGRGRGAAAADPVKMATQIKPDLWYIADGGANSVVEVTPEGLILGDTKNPGDDIETAFLAQLKTISPLPVKYVFNTHPHGDHISHNQYFIDHGATVVGLKHLEELLEGGS